MIDNSGRYRVLLDPDADGGAVRVVVPEGTSVGAAAEALAAVFADDPALDRATLVVGARAVGPVTGARIAVLSRRAADDHRSTPPHLGEGDGATLPGHSTAYAILRFHCVHCPALARLLFVDDGSPLCPAGHGAMVRTS